MNFLTRNVCTISKLFSSVVEVVVAEVRKVKIESRKCKLYPYFFSLDSSVSIAQNIVLIGDFFFTYSYHDFIFYFLLTS